MKTVLIIDDDSTIRQTLSRWLTDRHYAPITAENGSSGLTLARHHRPQLVLCDYRMPGMSGLDTLQQLRRERRTRLLPFVLLTAEVDMDHYFTSLGLGANGFLKKPLVLAECSQILRRFLSQGESSAPTVARPAQLIQPFALVPSVHPSQSSDVVG